MAEYDKDRIVGALRDEWASLDELIEGLDDEQWAWPSPLPGWDVRANVAHMVGTEAAILGRSPTVEIDTSEMEHVRNPIGAANEAWIASYADRTPAEILAEFRAVTSERLAVLGDISQERWDEVQDTPVGRAPYGRFVQIRAFDCWMHEQDIRYAIRMPGHERGLPVEVTLDELASAMGFVVGKKAGAPQGSSVTFDLTGATSREIHVAVGERATVVEGLDGPATATLTMPVISFSRIAGGRLDAVEHLERCTISGDENLGQAVLDNLNYTI